MNKTNFFAKHFNYLIRSINSLLEKNLNKLNFNNLTNLAKNNKIILTFVAVFVLFVSYLLIPTFYKQSDLSIELKNQLKNKFDLNFKLLENLNYNLFPRPHFTIFDSAIEDEEIQISKVKNLKIYIKLENLFPLKNLNINKVIIENANFNLDKKSYHFFTKILENDFKDKILNIKNSNVFFRNDENEVLFINKILDMNYYYDFKQSKNISYSKNNLFNLPYSIELINDFEKNLFYSVLNFNFSNFQIENVLDYNNDIKTGETQIILNKNKSIVRYKTNKNFFEFNFFDKLEGPTFIYEGNFNFNPFYSNFEGSTKKINLNYFFDNNSMLVQLLKTQMFNNKNIDFKLKINAKNIFNNFDFVDFSINSKIQDGLIDIDNTSFKWKNFIDFKIEESLIYVKSGELVLDGKLRIDINDYNGLYKYLLTPRNYRKEIKNIDLNFTYNFDQKIANLTAIKIDKKIDTNLNKIFSNVLLKKDNLQNKIYLKNLLNDAIKNYFG